MDKEFLEKFMGKLVTYTYSDERKRLRVQKGILIKVEDNFGYFQTFKNVFVVDLDFIKILKISLNDFNEVGVNR